MSNEIIGKVYSIVFHDRYIKAEEMNRNEILYFDTIKPQMKKVFQNEYGMIYESQDFKKKIGHSLRHNYLVRYKIIIDNYV